MRPVSRCPPVIALSTPPVVDEYDPPIRSRESPGSTNGSTVRCGSSPGSAPTVSPKIVYFPAMGDLACTAPESGNRSVAAIRARTENEKRRLILLLISNAPVAFCRDRMSIILVKNPVSNRHGQSLSCHVILSYNGYPGQPASNFNARVKEIFLGVIFFYN